MQFLACGVFRALRGANNVSQYFKSSFSASTKSFNDLLTDVSSQTSYEEVRLMRKYKRRLQMILGSFEADESLSRIKISSVSLFSLIFMPV